PLLPREIVYRPKKGFPVPTKTWFRNDLAGFARETLLDPAGPGRQFLSLRELEHLLTIHQYEDRSAQIYSLMVFDHWYREFAHAPVTDQRAGANLFARTSPVSTPAPRSLSTDTLDP